MKLNKSMGPDGLHPRLLNMFADTLAPVFTFIFNQSVRMSALPDDWRKADVVPIYKKGKKTQASNYRPVSLTCVVCKLLEHIIVSHIHSHLEKYDILSDLQHGFRSRRSCETQLLYTHYDLIQAKNRTPTEQVDLIILDMSKAFDKVSHPRLLAKCKAIGITGSTLAWIGSFLQNRSQGVLL